VRFTCEFCGRVYTLPGEVRGKALQPKCRACGHDLVARPERAARQSPPAAPPDPNPFVAAPVTVPPLPSAEAAAPAPAPVPSPSALPAPAPGGRDEFEDIGRTLSEALAADAAALAAAPAAAPARRPPPAGPVARTSGERRVPRLEPWPQQRRTGSLALPLKPTAGPRIALGVAALAVVAIAAAVVLLHGRGGDAAPVAEAVAAGGGPQPAAPFEGPAGTGVATDTVAPTTAEPMPAVRIPSEAPAPAGASAPEAPRRVLAGRVSSEDIARALSDDAGGFDACFAEAARRDPGRGFAGRRVTLQVTVAPNGSVGSPALDDPELAQSDLGACLKAAARRLSAPSFEGEPRRVDLPLSEGAP